MRLSDAIRKGAMQRPQIVGYMFYVPKEYVVGEATGVTGLIVSLKDGVLSSCALGAAWEGTYGEPQSGVFKWDEDMQRELKSVYPELTRAVRCPVCPKDNGPMSLESVIVDLNDLHHWTREEIADWLDTLPEVK